MTGTNEEQISLNGEFIEAMKDFHKREWHAAFIMDLENYKRVRRIIGPLDDVPEDEWVPNPKDLVMGYPVMVEDDGGAPHIALREIPLRSGEFAGVTRIGLAEEAGREAPSPGSSPPSFPP